jgi:hypothetical protein
LNKNPYESWKKNQTNIEFNNDGAKDSSCCFVNSFNEGSKKTPYLYVLLICSETRNKTHQSKLKIAFFSKTQNGFSRNYFLSLSGRR